MARKTELDRRLEAIISDHVRKLVETIEDAVRANVFDDLRSYLGMSGPAPAAQARPRERLILPCIAPGCTNPSKGPRFHYLCEVHKGASRKDYEAWRKAQREQAKRG